MVARVDTRPVAFVATVEAQASKAEAIASAFEEAENPEALAVTLFKRGEHRAKVSAYYAEQPARERLLELIESAAGTLPRS